MTISKRMSALPITVATGALLAVGAGTAHADDPSNEINGSSYANNECTSVSSSAPAGVFAADVSGGDATTTCNNVVVYVIDGQDVGLANLPGR